MGISFYTSNPYLEAYTQYYLDCQQGVVMYAQLTCVVVCRSFISTLVRHHQSLQEIQTHTVRWTILLDMSLALAIRYYSDSNENVIGIYLNCKQSGIK